MFGSLIQAGEVNLTGLPSVVNDALMLESIYVARLVVTLVLFVIIVFPLAYFATHFIIPVLGGMSVLIFSTAIGWLDSWILVFMCMVVAGLWTVSTLDSILR